MIGTATLKRIWTAFRSAITGRFVTKKYADEHPDTTVAEKRVSTSD